MEIKINDVELPRFKESKVKIKADEITLTSDFDIKSNGNIKCDFTNDFVVNTNKTLYGLRQKLINDLYSKEIYNSEDLEIMKILFENNNI